MTRTRSFRSLTGMILGLASLTAAVFLVADLVSRTAYTPSAVSLRVAAAEHEAGESTTQPRAAVRIILPSPYHP